MSSLRYRLLTRLLPALCAVVAVPAQAALPIGAKAPGFSTEASQGGREFRYTLADALHRGPVVLYFYPAAFTSGCTIEAHEFAEAIPRFQALGATVVGISMDGIKKLDAFSTSECRGKFPVAADPDGKITGAYDSRMVLKAYAQRTSYVISPRGRILSVYSDPAPDGHVDHAIAALTAWEASHHG